MHVSHVKCDIMTASSTSTDALFPLSFQIADLLSGAGGNGSAMATKGRKAVTFGDFLNASASGELFTVRRCLEAGVVTNLGDATSGGSRALQLAAYNGHVDVCEYLVSKGCRLDAVDSEGRAAIHMAAMGGRAAMPACAFLLEAGAPIDARDSVGGTPLHAAARLGDVGMCEFLLGQGADVGAGNVFHETPLHYAARAGERDACAFLVENGADVHAEQNNKPGKGKTAMYLALEAGYFAAAAYLVSVGAWIEAPDVDGDTVLHTGIRQDRPDVYEAALALGASLDTRDAESNSALHVAASEGHRHIIQYLLDEGAGVGAVDEFLRSPLDLATRNPHISSCQLLFAYGESNPKCHEVTHNR